MRKIGKYRMKNVKKKFLQAEDASNSNGFLKLSKKVFRSKVGCMGI
jgi:hypothetical protein